MVQNFEVTGIFHKLMGINTGGNYAKKLIIDCSIINL
jgi:hypothetical protein